MYTLEKKINIVLRYIATNDRGDKAALRKLAIEILNDEAENPTVTVDDVIDGFLKDVGCYVCLKGYDALAYAIKLVVYDETYVLQMMKRLYPDVATHMNWTPINTERNIRTCIEKIFDIGDSEDIHDIFGGTISKHTGKLQNSEFLAASAKEVRRRMKRAGIEI